MSSMAKAARAAMKAKASRMGGKGDPKTKVDASSWTPPEMMNTDAKVGMRPISRRAYKKGGKVIEKCEGGKAMKRADRKQRKSGGKATSLVTDLINRNDKKANKARVGGEAHVGGYKRGGDVAQDKAMIKKAIAQHDKHMHGGKHEEIKLKKGGRTHKQVGGSMPAQDPRKAIPGDAPTRGPAPGGKPSQATGAPYKDVGELIEKEKLAPRKRGGKAGGTYYGGTRPTGGRMPKADGGKIPHMGARKLYAQAIFKHGKTAKTSDAAAEKGYADVAKKYGDEMADNLRAYHASNERDERARGGRTKGKTNIVISINAQKPDQQQAMMPKMPTPPPMPVPPVAPPPMGAGAPPMPMPPASPPPGLGGGAPGGMPPMPRKSGGRAYRSYKDMDAGAMSGMGRLEKTEIQRHKR